MHKLSSLENTQAGLVLCRLDFLIKGERQSSPYVKPPLKLDSTNIIEEL